jgi:hypothetical protein
MSDSGSGSRRKPSNLVARLDRIRSLDQSIRRAEDEIQKFRVDRWLLARDVANDLLNDGLDRVWHRGVVYLASVGADGEVLNLTSDPAPSAASIDNADERLVDEVIAAAEANDPIEGTDPMMEFIIVNGKRHLRPRLGR